ncbi:MAG: mevalonate kinase [Promethearchaeota archaeon]
MLNQIIKYINNLNPAIIVQAPSRINLINPLDAVEGDFWMPSVAINAFKNPLSTFVYIKTINNESRVKLYDIIKVDDKFNFKIIYEKKLPKSRAKLKMSMTDELKLVHGSIYRFSRTNSYFWEKFKELNIEIGIISTIPRQSGLGGSASIIIAVLYALARYFGIYNNLLSVKHHEYPINKDIIAEMATKVEVKDLKITAGFSDRYSICRGGIGFCSYVGKLYHKKISMEPIAVYDRIDKIYNITNLPVIVCYSGIIHDSGNVHKRLRKLYLLNDLYVRKKYKLLANLAWKSRFALMKHDWKFLGELFNKNNQMMNKIMQYAGFKHGIGFINNLLIKLIEDYPGVYAVKLTGAGGGGSVFALTNPERNDEVLSEWKRRLNNLIKNKGYRYDSKLIEDLRNAEFFKIKISYYGVKKI